jgi:hypothetical protein
MIIVEHFICGLRSSWELVGMALSGRYHPP